MPTKESDKHDIPAPCVGESCGMCYRENRSIVPATHKVGEEILDGYNMRHNLTQYVCCKHFGLIVGPESAKTYARCAE